MAVWLLFSNAPCVVSVPVGNGSLVTLEVSDDYYTFRDEVMIDIVVFIDN